MSLDAAKELRCFCRNSPLLAMYGIDKEGELYIHVRIYKQNRIYGEFVTKGKDAISHIRCRNCLRWHRIRLRGNNADLVQSQAPDADSPVDR